MTPERASWRARALSSALAAGLALAAMLVGAALAAGPASVSWVPSSPVAGDTLTVFLTGFQGHGAVNVVLRDLGSGTVVDQDHVTLAQGFATLTLPDHAGSFRIEVQAQAAGGTRTLYRSGRVVVDPPPYQLSLPASVAPGDTFEVQLGRSGGPGDVVQLVFASGGGAPAAQADAEGASSVSLQAPDSPGPYTVQVVSGADGSVLASVPLTVGDGGVPGAASCPSPPDSASLKAAFGDAVQAYLSGARAMYGAVYRDLQYSFQVQSATVDGDQGSVVASYSGSVTEIANGKVDSASGTIDASFQWQSCSWTMTGFTY